MSEPTGAAGGKRRRSRRWVRLVAPISVVIALMLATVFLYLHQQPDPSDPGYLSPTSRAGVGGRTLADRLTERGVTVLRQTRTADALVEAAKGDTTLFVPAPGLVHPYYLRMIKLLPASTRVVLVAPDVRTLANGRIPAGVISRRMAAAAVAPGCRYDLAVAAGRAAVLRTRYDAGDTLARCYSGALTVVRRGQAEVTLVGAADPFRNDRIGEYHNAALAAGLLSVDRRVLWLDLHRLEARPGFDRDARPNDAPPSLAPGSPDPDFPLPSGDWEDPDHGDWRPQGDGRDDTGSGGEPPNPLWRAFPSWVFAAAVLTVLAMVLVALARGRRLGGPVPEPLPVVVRATETVRGRGRLYQRAKARGVAASTLRHGARQRLAHLLDLPAEAPAGAVVAAVAAQAGWPAADVEYVLYGREPADDRELVQVALAVEQLLAAVTRQATPFADPTAPHDAPTNPEAPHEVPTDPAAPEAPSRTEPSEGEPR